MTNGMLRLSRSRIEYIVNSDGSQGYSWGIFSGCLNWQNGICLIPNCWARTTARRFPSHYPNNFTPTIYPEALLSPLHLKKSTRIGVGFMGDLIGYADPGQKVVVSAPDGHVVTVVKFQDSLFDTIRQCQQHDFLFLTKNSERLKLWSPFPDNAWCGVSICSTEAFVRTRDKLRHIDAKIKWLSFEPLLDWDIRQHCADNFAKDLQDMGVSWLIIGSQTRPTVLPRIAWVKVIVEACQKAKIPYWLKYNLVGHLPIARPFYTNDDSGWAICHELPK